MLSYDVNTTFLTIRDEETRTVLYRKYSSYVKMLTILSSFQEIYKNALQFINVKENKYVVKSFSIKFQEISKEDIYTIFRSICKLTANLQKPINYCDNNSVFLKKFLVIDSIMVFKELIPELEFSDFGFLFKSYKDFVEDFCLDYWEKRDDIYNTPTKIRKYDFIYSNSYSSRKERLEFDALLKFCYITYMYENKKRSTLYKLLSKLVDNIKKQDKLKSYRGEKILSYLSNKCQECPKTRSMINYLKVVLLTDKLL